MGDECGCAATAPDAPPLLDCQPPQAQLATDGFPCLQPRGLEIENASVLSV